MGKVRHLEVKFLWLQEVVRDRRLEVRKIHGAENPADLVTKLKSAEEVALVISAKHMRMIAREGDAPTDSVGVVRASRHVCECCRRCSSWLSKGV